MKSLKKHCSTRTWLIALTVFALTHSVIMGYCTHKQRDQINALEQTQSSKFSAIESALSYSHPVVSVEQNKVYLTSLHLALPLNDATASLVYSLRSNYKTGVIDEADVSTIAESGYLPLVSPTRSCTDVVRLKFEAKPNPYNPQEKSAASVPLSDGRILQVYSYHLASCATEWRLTNTDPEAIASTFKEASLY